MRKKDFFRNSALYLVFLSNTIYTIAHGFSWPYLVAAVLTLAVLILDIVEVVRRGRR